MSSGIEIRRLPPFKHRMRASDFRCRAVLQEQILTPDGAGGTTQHWDDIGPFWTNILPMSLYEVQQAALVGSVVDTKVVMRDPGDLTLKLSATGAVSRLLRFVYGTHIYKIAGILDYGEIVVAVCSEIQPTA